MTLTCTVTKPAEVIPQVTVTWYHDEELRNGVAQLLNGGATVTNTLRFDSSVSSDSGNYTCVAELVTLESMNITQSTTIEVVFRSEYMGSAISEFIL